jgi:tetratricopeptide (TPR) repeat protein
LVDARDDTHLWGEQYNRRLSDILAVQEEIARDISGKLRQRLTGEEKKRLTRRYTENPEAYGLYLKGRYHWNKRTGQDLQKGIGYFQQAIEKDPTYALAYAGLADCYAVLFLYAGLPSSENFPKAKAAASKALEIDDTLAQAHTALAYTHEVFYWDFSAAEKEYRRAIELDPKYPQRITGTACTCPLGVRAGDREQSAPTARSAVAHHQHRPRCHLVRARSLTGQSKRLADDRAGPKLGSAHMCGWGWLERGRCPEAIAAFAEAVGLGGRSARR